VNSTNTNSSIAYCSTSGGGHGVWSIIYFNNGTQYSFNDPNGGSSNTNYNAYLSGFGVFSYTAYSYILSNTYWIWNSSTAYTSAQINTSNPLLFSYTYNNNTGSNITAYLMVGVINLCSVYLNGNILILNQPALGGAIFNPIPTTVTIPPGNNTFSFYCTNGVYSITPTPSGFFCSCFTSTSGSGYTINSSPSVLFSTGSLTGWNLSITGYKINGNYMIDSFNPVSIGTDNWTYNTTTYGNTNLNFTYDVSGTVYNYDVANMFDISYNSTYGLNPSTNGKLTTNYFIMYNGVKTDIGSVLSTQPLPPPTYSFTTINNVSIKSTYISTYDNLQNITYNNCMSKSGKYQIILASCTTGSSNNTITYYRSSDYGQSFSLLSITGIIYDYSFSDAYYNSTNIMSILNCSISGDGKYVYIYLDSAGLNPMRSSDYGVTFSTSLGNNFNGQYGSVVVSSTGQYVFFVDGYGNQFYFSSDYGVTFSNKSNIKSSMGSACISGNDTVFCYAGYGGDGTGNAVFFWNNSNWITAITNNNTNNRQSINLSSVSSTTSTIRNMIVSDNGYYIGVFYYPNYPSGSPPSPFYNFSLLNTTTFSETRFKLGANAASGCIINSIAASGDFTVFYAIKMWVSGTPDVSGSLYVSTNLTSGSPSFTPVINLTNSPFYNLASSSIKTFMISSSGQYFTAVKADNINNVTSISVDGNYGNT
jgi:hypothetical protein